MGVEFGAYGRGQWAYFTNKPGMAAYTTINQVNAIRKRAATGNLADKERYLQESMMRGAVRWALEEKTPLTVKNAPAGILIKAFRKVSNNAIIVHILNCRGEKAVNFGSVIPAKYEVDYPGLDDDIFLELVLSSVKHAYLFSPDWNGTRAVEVVQGKKGVFRLIVPADALRRYSVLFVVC